MKLLVASFGGGVNSAAMLVGLRDRGIVPDAILFADTGGEKPETYQFIDKVNAWLRPVGRERGFPQIITVQNDGVYGELEQECLKKKTLPSLVFGWRSCSDKYKLRPQHKYIKTVIARELDGGPAHLQRSYPRLHEFDKAVGLAFGNVKWCVGIDAGESHRMGAFENCWHPLVEWGWDRAKCIEAIKRAGLPVPTKSACFFCPASTKSEVKALSREHPDLFARAVAMEQNAEGLQVDGLGRHFSWEKLVAADEAQFKMFPEVIETPCMCFDGVD